jgi:hypothetical protein
MAKRETINLIIRTFKELGGNLSDVLGTRTNISFLGKGDNIEPFLDKNLNTQALGVLSQSKAVDEAKNAVGFAVGEKLNDIQANTLLMNLNKMKEFYMPNPVSNITDLGTGTRNLDAEGLASLRDPRGLRFDEDSGVLKSMVGEENASGLRMRKTSDTDLKAMAERLGLNDPNKNRFLQTDDLPPPGSRGGPDDIAAPVQSAEETIANLKKQDPEIAAQFESVFLSNRAGVPAKRANAREFLVEALKKDTLDPATSGFGKTNLSDVISAEDVKFITEGGGGIGGDPLVLVEKYFGPRIVELIPDEKITPRFINRLLTNVRDAAGRAPDDPRFDRFTATLIQEDIPFAKGGLAKILEV